MNFAVCVLIVEDDPQKQEVIRLSVINHTPNAEVHVATSVASGRRAVREKFFDLVLLDLLLPLADGNSVPSRTGGLTLLELLHTDDTVLQPRYVVGITSFDDIAEEQRSEFEARTWCIVRYGVGDGEWIQQLDAILTYISRTKYQESQTQYLTDILLVTALRQPEFEEILRLPIDWGASLIPVGDQHFLRRGNVEFSSERISIIAACTAKIGMVWTALLVDRIIREFRPRVVVMCGICMGMPNETKLGDLVVGVHSWNWQAGKMAADPEGKLEFRVQPEPVVATAKLCNLWHEFEVPELLRLYEIFEGKKPLTIPDIHIAPMVSGSSVVANDIVHPDIFKQDRKIRGVDMETLGVYAACDSSTYPKPKFLAVKSISDWGVPEKADDFQRFCAYMSAQSVFSFLRRFWSQL